MARTQIKTFVCEYMREIESEVNEFLDEIMDDEVIDIKYAIAHEAISTDSESGVYPSMKYTAIVIYKQSN